MRVVKEFHFHASHMLTGHKGLCKNLHGHTYKVEIEISDRWKHLSDPDSPDDMVIDFGDLKEIFGPVIEQFDHAFIYNSAAAFPSLESKIASILKAEGGKTVEMTGRPTAETMAYYFYRKLMGRLNELCRSCAVEAVRVWETETSYAEYRRNDV